MTKKFMTATMYHAPRLITGTARNVLIALAQMTAVPGEVCFCPMKRLAQMASAKPDTVQKALRRLADLGFDVRVPVCTGKDGRPVYAHNGSVSRYRVPVFEAPAGCPCGACRNPPNETAPTSDYRSSGPAITVSVTLTATSGRGAP